MRSSKLLLLMSTSLVLSVHGQLLSALRQRCVCHLQLRPVCTQDNKTFANVCTALCKRKHIGCHQRCPCPLVDNEEDGYEQFVDDFDNCGCSEKYQPVCDVKGNTLTNACKAKCQRRGIECHHQCPCVPGKSPLFEDKFHLKACTCELNPRPVCGVDGETYRNECFARCKEISIDCDGKCPC